MELIKFSPHLNRNDMIKMINCTLDDYAWVMEGADPPVPRCQNQSESYATIKASYEYEYSAYRL